MLCGLLRAVTLQRARTTAFEKLGLEFSIRGCSELGPSITCKSQHGQRQSDAVNWRCWQVDEGRLAREECSGG